MSYAPAMTPILEPRQYWHCNECNADHVTSRPDVHTPMHPCFAMKGLMVPFVPAGSKARLRINYREDYVRGDTVDVQEDGRVVMSIQTLHEDGREDCTAYAPCANVAGIALSAN